MTGVWSDITGTNHPETYEMALARSLVNQPQAAKTEAEIAAKLVADRERMRMHDRVLADNYLTINEQVIMSITLARMLGYAPHETAPDNDGDGWAGGDD